MDLRPKHRKEPPHTDLREWARAVPVRGTTKAVLLGLLAHSNKQGSCFPSVSVLAKTCGLSERAVLKAIQTLKSESWIIVTRHSHGKYGRKPNHYTLNTQKDVPCNMHEMHSARDAQCTSRPCNVHEVHTEVTISNNTPPNPPTGGRQKRHKREPMWKTATRKALDQVNDNTD